jgi:amino acid permease
MEKIDLTYRKRFYQWEGIAVVAIVIELTFIVLVLNSKFNFISGSDVVRAAISAILGFALMFTVTFAISIYKEYALIDDLPKVGINSQLKEILNEIDHKYYLITNEIMHQKELIESELNKDNGGVEKVYERNLKERLHEINYRLYDLSLRKEAEISVAFDKFTGQRNFN